MTSLLRPGLLVSLKTSLRGGVHYDRRDLPTSDLDAARNADAAIAPDDPLEVTRWETTRVITDKEEHERGRKVQSKASSLIRGVCSATSFGLLCPIAREEALDDAVAFARTLADNFNRSAAHSQVDVFVLKGRIAETDEEATRAIADEVRGLLDEMDRGIRGLDVASVRDAAGRARKLAAMLDQNRAEQITGAIEAAREAARAIVRRVEKNGENASAVLAELQTGPIERARFAFLELSGSSDPGASLPAIERQRFADLGTADLESAFGLNPDAGRDDEPEGLIPTGPARQLEL